LGHFVLIDQQIRKYDIKGIKNTPYIKVSLLIFLMPKYKWGMRKTIVLTGMPLAVLGAVLLSYGLLLRGQSIIESPGQWQVTWYAMRDRYGTWGDVIDSGTLQTIFSVDPLPLASSREEPIGFKALLEVQFPKDMTVQFTLGGDDGAIAL